MAIAFASSPGAVTGAKTTTSGTTFTFTITTSVGQALLIAVAIVGNSVSVSSIADAGNKYFKIGRASNSTNVSIELWATNGNVATGGTITVTVSGSGARCAGVCSPYTGVVILGDNSANSTGSTSPLTSGSTTLTEGGAWLITVGGMSAANTFTAQNGSLRGQTTTTGISVVLIDSNGGSSPATDSATMTASTWVQITAQLKAVGLARDDEQWMEETDPYLPVHVLQQIADEQSSIDADFYPRLAPAHVPDDLIKFDVTWRAFQYYDMETEQQRDTDLLAPTTDVAEDSLSKFDANWRVLQEVVEEDMPGLALAPFPSVPSVVGSYTAYDNFDNYPTAGIALNGQGGIPWVQAFIALLPIRATPGHAGAGTGLGGQAAGVYSPIRGGPPPGPQFSQATVVNLPGGADWLVLVYALPGGTGYGGGIITGAQNSFVIVRWDGVLNQVILMQTTSPVPNVGDVVRLDINGATLTLTVNGSAILTATDNTYGVGWPGLRFDANANTAYASNWSGSAPLTVDAELGMNEIDEQALGKFDANWYALNSIEDESEYPIVPVVIPQTADDADWNAVPATWFSLQPEDEAQFVDVDLLAPTVQQDEEANEKFDATWRAFQFYDMETEQQQKADSLAPTVQQDEDANQKFDATGWRVPQQIADEESTIQVSLAPTVQQDEDATFKLDAGWRVPQQIADEHNTERVSFLSPTVQQDDEANEKFDATGWRVPQQREEDETQEGLSTESSVVGQQTATDDFNRTTLGNTWKNNSGAALKIIGNQAGTGNGTTSVGAYTGFPAFLPLSDQFSQATIVSLSGTFGWHVTVRDQLTVGQYNAYGGGSSFGATQYEIINWINGSPFLLAFTSSQLPTVGDVVKLDIKGSSLTLFVNGSLLLTAKDGTWGSGYPGLRLDGSTNTAYADDWSGSIAVTDAHPLGVQEGDFGEQNRDWRAFELEEEAQLTQSDFLAPTAEGWEDLSKFDASWRVPQLIADEEQETEVDRLAPTAEGWEEVAKFDAGWHVLQQIADEEQDTQIDFIAPTAEGWEEFTKLDVSWRAFQAYDMESESQKNANALAPTVQVPDDSLNKLDATWKVPQHVDVDTEADISPGRFIAPLASAQVPDDLTKFDATWRMSQAADIDTEADISPNITAARTPAQDAEELLNKFDSSWRVLQQIPDENSDYPVTPIVVTPQTADDADWTAPRMTWLGFQLDDTDSQIAPAPTTQQIEDVESKFVDWTARQYDETETQRALTPTPPLSNDDGLIEKAVDWKSPAIEDDLSSTAPVPPIIELEESEQKNVDRVNIEHEDTESQSSSAPTPPNIFEEEYKFLAGTPFILVGEPEESDKQITPFVPGTNIGLDDQDSYPAITQSIRVPEEESVLSTPPPAIQIDGVKEKFVDWRQTFHGDEETQREFVPLPTVQQFEETESKNVDWQVKQQDDTDTQRGLPPTPPTSFQEEPIEKYSDWVALQYDDTETERGDAPTPPFAIIDEISEWFVDWRQAFHADEETQDSHPPIPSVQYEESEQKNVDWTARQPDDIEFAEKTPPPPPPPVSIEEEFAFQQNFDWRAFDLDDLEFDVQLPQPPFGVIALIAMGLIKGLGNVLTVTGTAEVKKVTGDNEIDAISGQADVKSITGKGKVN